MYFAYSSSFLLLCVLYDRTMFLIYFLYLDQQIRYRSLQHTVIQNKKL